MIMMMMMMMMMIMMMTITWAKDWNILKFGRPINKQSGSTRCHFTSSQQV
jgi:hypothetical protein